MGEGVAQREVLQLQLLQRHQAEEDVVVGALGVVVVGAMKFRHQPQALELPPLSFRHVRVHGAQEQVAQVRQL